MPMTEADFIATLRSEVPEAETTVREHLEDNEGGILLHLLIADLRRLAIDAYNSHRPEVLQRLLDVLDRALVGGTPAVNNAIAVSFVEDTGWWNPAMQPFVESWPSDLRAELRRQQEWRPE